MDYELALSRTGDVWSTLTEEEKVEVLQIIENHIAEEQGRLNCPIRSKALYTGTDGVVMGVYDRDDKSIQVNALQLEPTSKYGHDSERMIMTCLHEGRHAYQNQAIEGLIEHDDPEEVELWKQNLAEGHYIRFYQNPRAYYLQPVEVDARTFAENRYAALVNERELLESKEKTQKEAYLRGVFEQHMKTGNLKPETSTLREKSSEEISPSIESKQAIDRHETHG